MFISLLLLVSHCYILLPVRLHIKFTVYINHSIIVCLLHQAPPGCGLFSCKCCCYSVRAGQTCFTPQAQLRWNLSLPRSTSSSSTAPLRPTRSPCSCPEGWWSLSCIRFWMGSITSMPTGCSTGIWWAAILASLLQFPRTDTHQQQLFILEPFPKATPLTSQKRWYPRSCLVAAPGQVDINVELEI